MNQIRKKPLGIFIVSMILMMLLVSPESFVFAAPWQDKVDIALLETLADGPAEFIVFLSEQADLSEAGRLRTKLEKGQFVFETLSATAERTQGPLLQILDTADVEYRPYWVANFIWVRGGIEVAEALASRVDVSHIYANPEFRIDPVAMSPPDIDAPTGIEWNISHVNADDVWALGIDGSGAVIGGQDTGYDWDHPALKNQYLGWNGASVDHNYTWHDAIRDEKHFSGGDCGLDSDVPCDDYGHGTHTMGTIVGDDGGSNQIGMAPGARWIGCRNMDVGVGTSATYSECFQWFIAPTDLNNQNPNPAFAPDVINNSWSCPTSEEGCTDPFVLQSAVNNVRAAGIVVVASAGNDGSSTTCGTIDEPPAMYGGVFTVGGIADQTDAVYSNSSRGPAWNGEEYILKPNVVAPAVSVRSSVPGTAYSYFTGTSMAAPHVAGLIGLLIDAKPELAGKVDVLEHIIQKSALGLTSTQDCPPFPGSEIPNAVFGHGRIDALAAYQLANDYSFLYMPLMMNQP